MNSLIHSDMKSMPNKYKNANFYLVRYIFFE